MKIARTFITIITTASLLTLITMLPANAEYQKDSNMTQSNPTIEDKMAHTRYVNSDKNAYAAMQELPKDMPFSMLNMISFNDKAQYAEDSDFASKGWTGAEAYEEYSRHSSPIAKRVGGSVTYLGKPQLILIGPEHEHWDAIFIVTYPNLNSFLALIGDSEYQKHSFHRSAAVSDSRLIRMTSYPTIK